MGGIQPFTPMLTNQFHQHKIMFPSAMLRVVLLPAEVYVAESRKLNSCDDIDQLSTFWSSKTRDAHYIDNFDLHYETKEDGSLSTARVCFLLPVDLDLTRTHWGAMVNLYNGMTMMCLGRVVDMSATKFRDADPFLKWPQAPADVQLKGDYMKAVECEESEKDYQVTVKIYSEVKPRGKKNEIY